MRIICDNSILNVFNIRKVIDSVKTGTFPLINVRAETIENIESERDTKKTFN